MPSSAATMGDTVTDISGLHYFAAAGSSWDLSYILHGWFETASGEALNLNLSGNVAVSGVIVYGEEWYEVV